MPKITGPFWVWKRPKIKKFQVTLYPASGLPPEVCNNWKRKGFSRLPLELAVFREPKTKAAAEAGALALIEYLKNQLKTPEAPRDGSQLPKKLRGPAVGMWLERITLANNNPHAARLMGEGLPYSPDTLAMYQYNYQHYLKDDPIMSLNMDEVVQAQGKPCGGTRGSR